MPPTDNPRWPHGTAGPRALVECDDAVVQDGLVRVLREEGYAVAACGGPHTRAAGECPLVVTGACGLVEEADVVVHALDRADVSNHVVVAAIRARAPGTPVVVEAARTGDDDRDLPDGCERVAYPMSREALLAAVARTTGRSR